MIVLWGVGPFSVSQKHELIHITMLQIAQMERSHMRMVHYGDDTWLKLFPNAFMREDGTTSFFVADYTEVDDNVTRHCMSF